LKALQLQAPLSSAPAALDPQAGSILRPPLRAGGLPRMKAFIDAERARDPELLLLNAGDDFVRWL
jgi:2',3'-cyclic-nucleotide 2'-phosphodiesterase (5'-nucleotidase family)